MALLMPALAAVRESSRRTQCANNLHSYGIALRTYHATNKSFPIGNVANKWWTFQARLLPYLDGNDIYVLCNFKYTGDCFQMANGVAEDRDPGNRVLSYDVCPDDPNSGKIWFDFPGYGRHGCTNYLGMMGTTSYARDGILFYGANVSEEKIYDGISKTIIMGERGTPDDLYWGWTYCGYGNGTGDGDNLCSAQTGLAAGEPNDNHIHHFWSYHLGMANFCFADAAVRPLYYDIDFKVFQALSTRAGDEIFDSPW